MALGSRIKAIRQVNQYSRRTASSHFVPENESSGEKTIPNRCFFCAPLDFSMLLVQLMGWTQPPLSKRPR
jgi:hypothetical protein